MKIKRFEADSIPEALKEVKRELGADAVILQTRQLQTRRLFFLRGKPRAEVLAAQDVNVPARAPLSPRLREERVTLEAARTGEMEALRREVAELRATVRDLAALPPAPAVSGDGPEVDGLERSGLPGDLVERVRALRREGGDGLTVADAMASLLSVAPPPGFGAGRQTIVLVGPTGGGKTTTIAKLAARYALGEGRRTALVTMDTYRIGAVEQLRTYAEILKVPMEVAMSPAEVAAAAARHADKELILVDSTGRSQRKAMHLSEMEALVRAASPTEVHLVLPATSALPVQEEVIERFRPLGVSRLLLTKLDEVAAPVAAYAAAARSGLPLSYITDGQTVPDDLQVAEALRLPLQILKAA